MPHQCRDPLLAGCLTVQALQSIVSREVDPIDQAVVSVTRFHCGEAFNVIAETAEIGGTIHVLCQQNKIEVTTIDGRTTYEARYNWRGADGKPIFET
jgi:hippurate hydrolase